MSRFALMLLAMALTAPAIAEAPPVPTYPKIRFETTQGDFVVELDGRRAPYSVANFVGYVRDGFYQNTIFHRVIPGFMAQAGGMTPALEEKKTRGPIPNESGNGLSNRRGTIAMARTGDPHSATAQFYINLADNVRLDPGSSRWGYAVFGRVVEGMEVIDAIAEIPTGSAGQFRSDVPQVTVTIRKATLIDDQPPAPAK